MSLISDIFGITPVPIAHTGSIDMGCSYTLTGHSERRSYYAETPEIVAEKTRAAIMHSLTPVICIGETNTAAI